MCLGAQARAANENARRRYQYDIDRRERSWMQELSVYQQKQVQYELNTEGAEMAAQAQYGKAERERQQKRAEAELKTQQKYITMLQDSEAMSALAKGRTGRSVGRAKVMDEAAYGRDLAGIAYALKQNDYKLGEDNAKARAAAAAYKKDAFAKVAFQPIEDVAPPQPVMQNVGLAAFTEALSIAGTVAGGLGALGWTPLASDRRLKDNIQKIGESISGLGIYKFNYIGKAKQYIGAMADEVIKVVPEAVGTMSNGYLGVNYNLIDVTFKEV